MTIDQLPTLTTPRLTLRRFSEQDGQQIFDNYASDPMVARYVTWNAHTSPEQSRQLAKAFHDGSFGAYQWAIVLNQTGQLIGNISLVETDAEKKNGMFGYVLGQKWWNMGLATEALTETLRFLFKECGFETITGEYAILNPASGKVMEKCGLEFVRQDVKLVPAKNKQVDIIVRRITRDRWYQINRKELP